MMLNQRQTSHKDRPHAAVKSHFSMIRAKEADFMTQLLCCFEIYYWSDIIFLIWSYLKGQITSNKTNKKEFIQKYFFIYMNIYRNLILFKWMSLYYDNNIKLEMQGRHKGG